MIRSVQKEENWLLSLTAPFCSTALWDTLTQNGEEDMV